MKLFRLLYPTEYVSGIDQITPEDVRVFAAEDKRDGSLDVTGVQLGLFRIREKNNMESGFLVPAWYFTGVFHYSAAAAAQRSGFQEPDNEWYDARNPLLIINAIDGSIIDAEKGY